MAYHDLQDFIAFLDEAGELTRIAAEVDPELEITEIARRVMAESGPEGPGGKALLFEKVRGSPYPLLINAFGSERRMSMALNAESLDAKAAEIEGLINWAWSQVRDFSLIKTLPETFARLPVAMSLLPRRVNRPKCQEVIEDVDPGGCSAGVVAAGSGSSAGTAGTAGTEGSGEGASRGTAGRGFDSLPVLKCWPGDGGRFLTLPLVVTESLDGKTRNLGMYRMQIYDYKTAGMHWHIHKDGARFFGEYRKAGRRMPVAVALGCDPAVTYAATAPLPEGVWEMIFAGFLRGKSAEIAAATLSDLFVPADAEFVLEGYVDPEESRLEGPFGDHTGFYSLEDRYPVFHLQRITRRKNPVYPATIVGIPPKEDCWMAKATERLFLPLLRQLCPEIVDINMPLEGVFHNCLIVSIRKRYPGQARKVMNFLWGMGQLMYTKLIVVVDEEVNPRNLAEAAWRAFSNTDGQRDIVFSEGPLDALDHSSPLPCYGTRIGVDATRKGPGEGHVRPWPEPLLMDREIIDRVDRRWKEYGFK
jgi:4-hydroxy-3-polyprenylbenzoate decarboxylase